MGLKLAADAPISSGDCDLDPRDRARGAISLLADGGRCGLGEGSAACAWRTILHMHPTHSMADMYLWGKGFAHMDAGCSSRVTETTSGTFVELASGGSN